MRPSGARSWVLFVSALLIVAAWPPEKGRSLLVKTLNWAVDPGDNLPVLPAQLGFGAGDDVRAVEARDEEVRRYDQYLARGGFARTRLQLKVAADPFDPVTERQLLLVAGVIVAFLVLRR